MIMIMLPRCCRFALLLLLVAFLGQSGLCKDNPDESDEKPTCSETTRRVLAPYINSLLDTRKARVEYEQKLSRKREGYEDYILDLNDAIHALDQKREADAAAFDRQIELAQGALRKLGLLNIERTSIDGLPYRFDKQGWELYIKDQREKRAERMKAYSQGLVSTYMSQLGYAANLNGIKKQIAKQKELIAQCDQRIPSFYLSPLGYSANGENLDELLAKRQQELEDVKSEIRNGTWSLYVAAYGHSTNRNQVLEDIQEAEDTLDTVRGSWGKKAYKTFNKIIGHPLTNAKIEEYIADQRAKLKGEETKVYVKSVGYSISGIACREEIQKASAAKNSKDAQRWRDRYQDWRQAYAEFEKKIDEAVARLQKALELHHDLYLEEIERRQEHIDGKLKTALAQTPCGSALILKPDPKLEKIADHREKLSRLGADQNENNEAVDRYNDGIYIDSSNRVHGDLGDAWSEATGIPRSDKSGEAPSDAGSDSLAERYMKLKGHIDYLVAAWDAGEASKDLAEFVEAKRKVDSFLERIQQMSEAGPNAEQIRKALKSQLNGEISKLVTNGILSPKRIDQLLDAIEKTKAGTKRVRTLKQRLEAMKKITSTDLLSRIRSALTADIQDAYQPTVAKAVSEVSDQTKGMSAFDKAMVSLGVMNAVADSLDRIDKGVPVSEAVARSASNLAVELAINEIPLAAAADVATKVLFISYAHYSGDEIWASASVEDVAKTAMQLALDQVAHVGRVAGEQSVVLENVLLDRPNQAKLLANVDTAKLQRSLSHVEAQLDTIPPGHAEEARLMRIRASLRRLLRAKQQVE